MSASPGTIWSKDNLRRLASRETLFTVDGYVARYGIWLVLLIALIYYGQYYRAGLNLGGEGGTNAVIAMRLMEGQRPIQDTFLGYNVMWFYPIVGLFELTGPNYLALRLFFFALCTLGGILAFCSLRRITGSGIYSVLVATLVLLMPGMMFRNYMPFLGLLNMYLLLQAYVFDHPSPARRIGWMAAAGAGLGLTFLFRVDLGIFFTIINFGLAFLYLFSRREKLGVRFGLAGAGVALAVILFFLTHLPVYLDARARGFDQKFLEQYQLWIGMIRYSFQEEIAKLSDRPKPAPAPVVSAAQERQEVKAEEKEVQQAGAVEDNSRNVLQKLPLSAAWTLPTFYERAFVIITYLPILVSAVLLSAGGLIFLLALFRGDEALRVASLSVLTALGCALTLFPQFFFFRPDTPHLSEFMAPFMVGMGAALWFCLVLVFRRESSLLVRLAAGAVAVLCLFHFWVYTYQTLPKESGGTIAAKRKRTYEFTAENGVHVLVKRREKEQLDGIYATVMKYSNPDEYVVCYPYAPTINFFTNRRSFEYNLYVDNATAPQKFHDQMLANIEKYRPAIIIIDNRNINKSDSSRFATWAAQTYEHIKSAYRHAGTFGRQEIYVRPDKMTP